MKRQGMVTRATTKTTVIEDTGFGFKDGDSGFGGVFDGSSLSGVPRKRYRLLRTDGGANNLGRAAAVAAMDVIDGIVPIEDAVEHIEATQYAAIEDGTERFRMDKMEWAATSVWALVHAGRLIMRMHGDGVFAREITYKGKRLLSLTRYEFEGSKPPYMCMTYEEYITAMGGDENAELVTETVVLIERDENGYANNVPFRVTERKRPLKFAAHGVTRSYDLGDTRVTTHSAGVATDGVCDVAGLKDEWWRVMAAAWDVRVNADLEPLLTDRIREMTDNAPICWGDDVTIEKLVF